jgi:hypothetical protein
MWAEEDLRSKESLQDRAKMGFSGRSSVDKKTNKFRIASDREERCKNELRGRSSADRRRPTAPRLHETIKRS